MITAVNLCKTFRVGLNETAVLTNFHCTISRNERVALLGPSGCGKSTLLRIVAGLIRVDSGVLTISTKRVAMCFQEPRLIPWLTVRGNIELSLSGLHLKSDDVDRRIDQYLEVVELGDKQDVAVSQLSGGMAQRVNLARALTHECEVLVLDEPFSSVDAPMRARIVDRISPQLATTTVLIVTHDPLDAALVATRSIFVTGPPLKIRSEHTNDAKFPVKANSPELSEYCARLATASLKTDCNEN